MANRRALGVGDVAQFRGQGQVSASLPDLPAGGGEAARAAAGLFGGLANEIGRLADNASERQKAEAGLTDVQKAWDTQPAATPPADTAQTAQSGTFADRVIGVESGGRATSKSATSTAAGYGGFIDSTWAAFIHARHPELEAVGDIQKFRSDRSLSTEAINWYAAQNEAPLKAAGQPVNDATLYLAHFAGGGGAVKLLAADPTASAESVLGGDVVKVNPFLAKMNAADVVAWAGAKMQSAAAAGAARPPPPPLALRRDGSAGSAAYNDAAIRAYAWRASTAMRGDLSAAFDANRDDPAAFAAAADQVRRNYVDAGADPQTKELLEKTFAAQRATFDQDVSARTEARRDDEEKAAAEAGIDTIAIDVERQSYLIGANPAGDQVLEQQIARGTAAIDGAIADGSVAATDGNKLKDAMLQRAVTARVHGAFDGLGTKAQRDGMVAGLLQSWSSRKGALARLDYPFVKNLAGDLAAETKRIETEDNAANVVRRVELKGAIADDVASLQRTGKGVPVDPADVANVLGPSELLQWQDDRQAAQATYSATADFPTLSGPQMAARIAALEPEAGVPGYDRKLKTFKAAQAAADATLKMRETDPAMAVDTGFPQVSAVKEKFDPSQPETLKALVSARLGAQAEIGIGPDDQRPLTKPEARAISLDMRASPEKAEAWAMELTRSLGGDQAQAVLGQIADDTPGLAYAANIAVKGGDPTALRLLVGQQALERDPSYKPPQWKQAAAATIAATTYGDALVAMPRVQAALTANAQKMFLTLARQRGVVPDVSTSDGSALYGEALQMAAGATFSSGRQIGGIAEVNGADTLVPIGMPADRLEPLLTGIDDATLKKLPPIASLPDTPFSASDLAGAYFTAVGDGLYRVSLNPPTSADPRWLGTPEGGFWTLDVQALATRPGALAPGRRAAPIGRGGR